MNVVTKSASLSALGLPSGDHWVRFHVEGDSISFEVAASMPEKESVDAGEDAGMKSATGFVQKWGGSVKKTEAAKDAWLTHINEKHLR